MFIVFLFFRYFSINLDKDLRNDKIRHAKSIKEPKKSKKIDKG
jgi:hypothetical protein